jgi:Ser/Thr protein kinase RdoA (MazF antagonist)
MEARLASILERHYPHACPPGAQFAPAGGAGENSRNWFVLVRGERRFVLKSGEPGAAVAHYPALRERCPLLPELLPALDAQLCVRDRGDAWRLLGYLGGEHRAPGEAPVEAAALALAGVHVAMRQVPGSAQAGSRYLPLDELELAEAARVAPELAGELGAWQEEVRALEGGGGQLRAWVHRDFHPGNVLFEADRVTAVLDMDAIGTDLRMQAAAFGASRFGAGNPDREARFLDAYASVDPLGPAERPRYRAFVRREAIRRLNWILRERMAGGRAWQSDLARHLAVLRVG